MGDHSDEKTGAAADDVSRQHAEYESLEKVLPKHPQRADKSHGDQARWWKQDRRNPEAAHRDFPEVEHEGAEQQRDGEIDDSRGGLVVRPYGGESGDAEPRGAPVRQHEEPKARSRVTRNGGVVHKRERHGTTEQHAGERHRNRSPWRDEGGSDIERSRQQSSDQQQWPGKQAIGGFFGDRHDD